jgi:protein SCO1
MQAFRSLSLRTLVRHSTRAIYTAASACPSTTHLTRRHAASTSTVQSCRRAYAQHQRSSSTSILSPLSRCMSTDSSKHSNMCASEQQAYTIPASVPASGAANGAASSAAVPSPNPCASEQQESKRAASIQTVNDTNAADTTADTKGSTEEARSQGSEHDRSHSSDSTAPGVHTHRRRRGPVTWASFLFASCVFGGIAYFYRREKDKKFMKSNAKVVSIGKPALGGPFSLQGMDGESVTDKDFRGQYILLYFGFTHCPDICPEELAKMGNALDIVDEAVPKSNVTPVFVSVDPRRDTPARLKEYKKQWHPRMVMLTGSNEQIKNACRQFRVYYSEPPDTTGDYLVDHSIFFYLMDRDGEFMEYFGKNLTADEVATKMSLLLDEDLRKKRTELSV